MVHKYSLMIEPQGLHLKEGYGMKVLVKEVTVEQSLVVLCHPLSPCQVNR